MGWKLTYGYTGDRTDLREAWFDTVKEMITFLQHHKEFPEWLIVDDIEKVEDEY